MSTDNKFEREMAAFEQNSEHLRSLNQLLWQVPLIAMTLTGGAWYGVAQLGAGRASEALLILVGLADIGLIIVMARVRFVFGRILDATKRFFPEGAVDTTHWLLREWVVVGTFSTILLLSALFSLAAVVCPSLMPVAVVTDSSSATP